MYTWLLVYIQSYLERLLNGSLRQPRQSSKHIKFSFLSASSGVSVMILVMKQRILRVKAYSHANKQHWALLEVFTKL